MHTTTSALLAALLAAPAFAQQGAQGTLFKKETGEPIGVTIEKLLVDNAAGSVSAASLAGVESDTMAAVENVRDFSLLLKGFDSSAKAFGVAITPARTNFPFPSYTLGEYAAEGAFFTRLMASLTLSYAQGKSDIDSTGFTRRAVSVSTSGFWKPGEDPVVIVARARQCGHAALDALGDDKPSLTQDDIDKLVEEASKAGSAGQVARKARRASQAQDAAAKKAWDDCITPILKQAEERWNRSRYSISFATGSIRRTDGSSESVNLGRTLAMSAVYGFDGVDAFRLADRAAVMLTLRRSQKEPVLASLVAGPVAFRSSTIMAVRLSGGSPVFRGLIEANNAKDTDITTSQRTLRRALGIDYRIMDGLWLNLRYGRQHKLDGSGQDETGSFLVLNYSPSALLGR